MLAATVDQVASSVKDAVKSCTADRPILTIGGPPDSERPRFANIYLFVLAGHREGHKHIKLVPGSGF